MRRNLNFKASAEQNAFEGIIQVSVQMLGHFQEINIQIPDILEINKQFNIYLFSVLTKEENIQKCSFF